MCLAIAARAGKRIPENHIRQGWARNSHGAGIAYIDSAGEIAISKGHMTLKALLEAYDKAWEANQNSPFLLHLRYRTAGANNAENTHPFAGKYGAMIHNGHFGMLGDSYKKSDTAEFAEVLASVPEDKLREVLNKLRSHIGRNKLAFLLPKSRELVIFPNAEGHWNDGIWYSNDQYVERTHSVGTPPPTNHHFLGDD